MDRTRECPLGRRDRLGVVLTNQTIGILVAPAPPGAARVTEEDIHVRIDRKLNDGIFTPDGVNNGPRCTSPFLLYPRITAGHLGVVGCGSFDQPVHIEEERLGRLASKRCLITKDHRVYAGEAARKAEVQIRNPFEGPSPIIAHHGFSPQLATSHTDDLGDEWARHFEVLRIVGQHAIQIMRVPGVDPMPAEVLRKLSVEHKTSFISW